jgi:hypothetical protein
MDEAKYQHPDKTIHRPVFIPLGTSSVQLLSEADAGVSSPSSKVAVKRPPEHSDGLPKASKGCQKKRKTEKQT